MTAVAASQEELNLGRAIARGCRLIAERPIILLLTAALLAFVPAVVDAWVSAHVTVRGPLGPQFWKDQGLRLTVSYATRGVNWIFQGGVALLAASNSPSHGLPRDTSFRLLGGRAPLLFASSVATNVTVGLGTLALIVPGVLMGLAWCLAPAVAAVENRSLVAMLRRSADLTRGHRGALFGLFAGYFVLRLVVVFGPRLAIGLPLSSTGETGPGWLFYGVAPVMSAALSLLYAAVMASVYLELRHARDGGVAEAFD